MTPAFPSPSPWFRLQYLCKVINEITEYYGASFKTLPSHMKVVVNHISALLTVDYVESMSSIKFLLRTEATARKMKEENEKLLLLMEATAREMNEEFEMLVQKLSTASSKLAVSR